MNTKQTYKTGEIISIQESQDFFKTYSFEKINRLRKTDPTFNEPLYQEALDLVLSRLQDRLKFTIENNQRLFSAYSLLEKLEEKLAFAEAKAVAIPDSLTTQTVAKIPEGTNIQEVESLQDTTPASMEAKQKPNTFEEVLSQATKNQERAVEVETIAILNRVMKTDGVKKPESPGTLSKRPRNISQANITTSNSSVKRRTRVVPIFLTIFLIVIVFFVSHFVLEKQQSAEKEISLASDSEGQIKTNDALLVEESQPTEETPKVAVVRATDEAPTTEKTPTVAVEPATDEVPTTEKTPTVAVELTTDEAPTTDETPQVDALRATDEAPTTNKTPTVAVELTANEAPTTNKTPQVDALRTTNEEATAEGTPSVNAALSAKKLPMAEKTLTVDKALTTEETPPIDKILPVANVFLAKAISLTEKAIKNSNNAAGTAKPQIVIVDVRSLNMRNGPNVKQPFIKRLKQGTVLIVKRIEENGWLQVQDPDNIIGWVAGSFTQDQTTGKRLELSE